MASQSAGRPAPVATEAWVEVTSGPVADVTKLSGTVVALDTEVLLAGSGGVITRAAERGATIEPGVSIFRVGERPSVLLPGSVPAFRRLGLPTASAPAVTEAPSAPPASTLQSGADVRQLEAFLASRNLDPGPVDGVFDRRTSRSVDRLRSLVDLPPGAGALDLGEYLFVAIEPPWRVVNVLAGRGTRVEAGAPIAELAGTRLGIRVESATAVDSTVTFTAGGVAWRPASGQTASPASAEEKGSSSPPVEEILLEPQVDAGSVALGRVVTVEVRRLVSDDAVAVPVGAVRRSSAGMTFVWCGDRSTPRRCAVTLGQLVGDMVVVEGLPTPTSVRVGGG